ncbi:MAG: MalM family protein [Comamonadaceae bacterium]|nr:MalM family protein [Comamonadaceae bacterium]
MRPARDFVQAFEIPANLDRATITIDAIAGKTVFVPTVLILNDRFQATRAVDSSRFRYTPASFMEPQRLTGGFCIDRTRSGLLAKDRCFTPVFTTDRDLDGSTQMISELRLYRRAHALADPATPNPVASTRRAALFAAEAQRSRAGFKAGWELRLGAGQRAPLRRAGRHNTAGQGDRARTLGAEQARVRSRPATHAERDPGPPDPHDPRSRGQRRHGSGLATGRRERNAPDRPARDAPVSRRWS